MCGKHTQDVCHNKDKPVGWEVRGDYSHSANGSEHGFRHDQQVWHALMIVLLYRGLVPPVFTCYSYCIWIHSHKLAL